MKAPDKIWIDTDLINFHILNEKFEGDVEYIHKAALLEWTKEQLAYYQKLEEEEGDHVRWGQRNAFQQVIDKINSL